MATAFAVYSVDDKSLCFYKRDSIPSVGSMFEGKTATAVFGPSDGATVNINLETYEYTGLDDPIPWNDYYMSSFDEVTQTPTFASYYPYKTITVVDKGIAPVDIRGWFNGDISATVMNLSKLDVSKIIRMEGLFINSKLVTTIDISGWDTTNVTDMERMFCSDFDAPDYRPNTIENIYVGDKWNVENVTNSSNMFAGCAKLPNYNSSVVDKTNAHYNSGGYLTYKAPPAPTITFNSTTGTFSDSTTTKSVQTNLDGTVSLNTLVEFPIKQSYVFKGWSTTENGSVVYTQYSSPTITEDTTLYAVWEEAESYLIREDTLVNIANAVRAKTGGTDAIALGDMATMVNDIATTNVETITVDISAQPNGDGAVYFLDGISMAYTTVSFNGGSDTNITVIKDSMVYVSASISYINGGTKITSGLYAATSNISITTGRSTEDL